MNRPAWCPARRSTASLLATLLLFGPAACAGRHPPRSETAASGSTEGHPEFALGHHSWDVTASPEAQRWFNQGQRWMYAFNHDEAIRAFTRAAELDPSCAMAWWGIALCKGPHINNTSMDDAACRAAWNALEQARKHAPDSTAVEQALIRALGARYADPSAAPPPLDATARAPLDRAYADAMRDVHRAFPDHVDVKVLCAEALMDLRPWDLWSLVGLPRPETPEILQLLESALRTHPEHPGANHYYIHAIEASPNPERAEQAADRLRTLVPDSGHLVHMPSHIDVRLGRWNLAAEQNAAAAKVHDAYERRSPHQGLYRGYMFHNTHFRAYACMMAGRKADALAAARAMLDSIPADFYRDFAPIVDAYAAIEIEVMLRFGLWPQLLALPEPRASLPVTRALWRFARAAAQAAQGNTAGARAEQRRFQEQARAIPPATMMAINPAQKILSIADDMLEGEILFREGHADAAVERLQAAVRTEDTLMYMEPPDWVQPVRHTLAAVLHHAGRSAEAAEVYREDLRRWPENGWSLHGLADTINATGNTTEAAMYRERARRAWSQSDIKPGPSCLCVPAPR
ncbi:MAG: tetratricopeptide repeat protein [Phycisphaerales bacterium]|nr:tetratricopeptide repeat protein [Phycisphaerales bacterium]